MIINILLIGMMLLFTNFVVKTIAYAFKDNDKD